MRAAPHLAPRAQTVRSCTVRPRSFVPRRADSTSPPKRPTLHYFNIQARAEVIRLVLEESATLYDFKVVNKEKMMELKQSGRLPFGQVPFYEDQHVAIAQSSTIARYLAKKHGLFGSNEIEAVHIDELFEGTLDLYTKLRAAVKAEEAKKVRRTLTLTVVD